MALEELKHSLTVLFQIARREAFKVAAKRIAPYQKIIESYGYS